MNDIVADKARLRERARAGRARLTPAERSAAALAVSRYAPDIAAAAKGGAVSCFSTFGDELATMPLTEALSRRGVDLALPVVVGRGKPLVFRRWRRGDPMGRGPFGIAEPLDSAPQVEPAVFLVPLLAFDRRGYRIGYGGGFYDRTLALARSERPVLALGLAFAAQEVERVPAEEFDEPVDGVLTERESIRCTGGVSAAALPW